MNRGWLYVLAGGVAETAWATCLKFTDGFAEQVRDFAAILDQGIVQENERGTLDMTLDTPHFIPQYGEN